jgi:hypothetical protein
MSETRWELRANLHRLRFACLMLTVLHPSRPARRAAKDMARHVLGLLVRLSSWNEPDSVTLLCHVDQAVSLTRDALAYLRARRAA